MTGKERRAAIAIMIECAFVKRGMKNIHRRLFVCLRGRAPSDLPPRNPRLPVGPQSFDPATCPTTVRLETVPDWSEAQPLEALAPFLAGRTRWSSFPEFQEAGLALIYRQVERHGGSRHWARLLGLPWVPPRAEREKWPDDRIRAELRAYLKGKAVWPVWREFRRDGQGVLRDAVKWSGGPERWARELRFELPANQREVNRWTYIRLKEEVARFTEDRTEWPTRQEFQDAGRGRLYGAVQRAGARERLACELGLYLPPGCKAHRRNHWTEPAARAALDQLLEGRAIWPTAREFRAAGLCGLHDQLSRAGTRDAWARRYGLTVRPPGGVC